MKSSCKRKLAYSTIAGIALIALFIVIQSPVFLRIPDFHSVRRHPRILILNPFRNREPEITANAFLGQVKDGKCLEVTSSFLSRERSAEICENQSRFPLLSWALIDLEVESGAYVLTYEHTSRNAYEGEEMRVWVKRNEHIWNVVGFTAGY